MIDDSSSIPQKQCSMCPNSYPATPEFFCRDKSKKDGLRNECKQCKKQNRLKNRERDRLNSLRYANEHREEKRAYDRRYVAEHREERTAYNRQYNEQNRELVTLRRQRYYQQHKEHESEYNKRYYRANKVTYLARKKRYHAANRAKGRERARKRRQNPEYREYQKLYGRHYRKTEHGKKLGLFYALTRRARKKAAPGTLTTEQIALKLRTQRYRCYYCQKHFEKRKGKYVYHLDHTIPLSRAEYSPRHDVNYVVLTCPSCNLKKHDKLPHEFYEGGRLF